MQQTASQLAKTDPAAAQAMQQAAQTGQQQNVSAQMKAGAEAQRQNQQASAQQAQAQVEVGLQTMIHQLEEAQRRKLEALAKQLADMQEQIANLLRQQSGLNYDNLSLQGDAALKKADAKVIDHLLELAERAKEHLPPTPDLDTQTRLQQQTERNTRGVSKSAEALPDGAAIVADLNRAADRMGRAISAMAMRMRDDAGERYRRSRVWRRRMIRRRWRRWLRWRRRRSLIDQQAAKGNQALNDQKKDAIRAAYQKILESQKKIDADTVAMDKAPRLADGQLGHRDAILLDQLPPRQDVLAGLAAKLEDDLSSLNSIVYVWANHDIVDSMKSVREELAKPQTDVVTQAEQTRIEEQIQAMIDSLSVKPKEIPFANKSSGGGGKGSGPAAVADGGGAAVDEAIAAGGEQGDRDHQPEAVTIRIRRWWRLGDRQGQLRDVLDQLLQKASHGQTKLGPEPDPKDKLPEEASDGERLTIRR